MMAAINCKRVWIGALAGGLVWNVWSSCVNAAILGKRYAAAQAAGQFLSQPRYRLFTGYWIILLFVLALLVAHLYASVRATLGPGPRTALKIGVLVGFVAGFPMNFSIATWSPLSRHFPLWWMLDLWVGAILASFVAGWLYQD